MPAFNPVLNVSDLNGTNGFRINGAPYDELGWSVGSERRGCASTRK